MLEGRNVDKSIIDRGWQEMSSILDAEMPVQTSNRRGIIWLILGLIFIVLILMGYGFFLSGNGSESSVEIPGPIVNSSDQIKSPENESESSKQTYSGINKEDLKNDDIITSITGNQDADRNEMNQKEFAVFQEDTEPNNNQKKEPENTTRAKYSKNIDNKSVVKVDDAGKEDQSIPLLRSEAEESILIENTTHDADMVRTEQSEELASLREPLNIGWLPPASYLVSLERSWNMPPVIFPLKEIKDHRWMAYMSSRVIKQESLNVELGVSYEIPVFSGFYLFPQIGYGIDRIDYLSVPGSSRAMEFSAANGLDSELLMSNLRVNNEKGNFISLGLDGGFQLWKSWNLVGGINYRVYTALSSDSNDELAQEDVSVPNQSGGMSTSAAEIRINYDLYYRMGLYHQVSSRIGAALYFYHQRNYPFEVFVNGVKNRDASSDFFPRKQSVRLFLTFGF